MVPGRHGGPMTTPLASTQDVTVRMFVQRFSSTPLGARLARHLVLHQLDTWGFPHSGRLSESAAVLVAELSANAVTHGRVPGRDFEVRMELWGPGGDGGGLLRLDIADTRGELRPPAQPPTLRPLADDGRGLALVEAVADRWTVLERASLGKTVRAELDLPVRGPHRLP